MEDFMTRAFGGYTVSNAKPKVGPVGLNEFVSTEGVVYATSDSRRHGRLFGSPVHGTGRFVMPHTCVRHKHHEGPCNCFCGATAEGPTEAKT